MFDTLDAFLETWSHYLYDKGYLHHFIFGVLIALPFFYIFRHQNTKKQRPIALSWGAICLLAPITIEVAQCFIPERTCDFFDAFSSMLGSGLVYYLSQRRKGYIMKKRDYRFSLVLVLMFLIPCLSYAADDRKEPLGFFDIRFGQTKADFLSEYGPESEWKVGDNPFKEAGVNTIEIEMNDKSMAIDFYQDRLFSVCVGFLGVTEEEVKTIFQNSVSKYGVPDKIYTEDGKPMANWTWEKATAFFTYFPKKRAAFIVVSDREVIKAVMMEHKKMKSKL